MKKILTLVLSAAAALSCSNARAADWPIFRGPNHNGISTETNWLAKWPQEGPKRLWKASLGVGYAGITVANGRTYAAGNQDNTATLFCFDAETGSNIWKFSFPNQIMNDFSPPRGMGGTSSAATIEGNRAYLLSGDGCLFALDTQGGAVVWSNNLAAELGADKPHWGFTGAPLIQDNLLVLDIGSAGAAVDKSSGKVVWHSDKAGTGYSTPVPCSFNGTPAVALVTADHAYALETKTGKQIWSFPFKAQINIADVVVSSNDFFMSAGYNYGAMMARFDGTNAVKVWANQNFGNQINTSILIDGFLYGPVGAVNSGSMSLQCVDFATGERKWSFDGLAGGGLIAADHKIITLSDKGELVVGEASPAAFTPISRAQVLGQWCWCAPTLANGRIYCRNNLGDLVCLDVKGP